MTEAHVAALARFISERTGGYFSGDSARVVMTEIVSGPEAIFDLRRGGERLGVALVIDTCQTEGNAAELSVFPGLLDEPGDDGATLDELLTWGEAHVARGPRDHVDVPAWPGVTLPPDVMAARGYRRGYLMYGMRRPEEAGAPPPAAAPPAGWRWTEVGEPQLRDYHDTWAAAFATVPGAYLTELESFCARALSGNPPAQLLLDPHGRVQAFVRAALHPDGTGEIGSLGRHPNHRGHGLGPILLARGLHLLWSRGARQVRLEVAAANEPAIELYRSFAFEVTSEMPVYRRPA